MSLVEPTGLIDLKIPGTGSVTIHANPGPEVMTFRPEHSPANVHLGGNDGPRIDVEKFRSLSPADARKMTKEEMKMCGRLTDAQKELTRTRQAAVFKYGRYIAKAMSMPIVRAESFTSAFRPDPVKCAELIETIGPPPWMDQK